MKLNIRKKPSHDVIRIILEKNFTRAFNSHTYNARERRKNMNLERLFKKRTHTHICWLTRAVKIEKKTHRDNAAAYAGQRTHNE